VNLTADSGLLTSSQSHMEEFLTSLPTTPPPSTAAPAPWATTLPRANEAIVVPTQVNYVGKAANLYDDAGYKLHGSVHVIVKHLGMTHIWDRVRVMGGAYGGFCNFDTHSGLFQYQSYRSVPMKRDDLGMLCSGVVPKIGLDVNAKPLNETSSAMTRLCQI
jgi:presequence protease